MNDEKLAETPPRQDEERDAALESALRTSPTWSNHSQDLSKETGEPQTQKEDQNATPQSPKDDAGPMQSKMSLPNEIAFVALICSAQFLTQAGLGMALSTMYIIGDSFGIRGTGKESWYIAAFSLTAGTFILPAGRIGDVYGHKKLFVLGWLVYSLFSLLSGFSVYVTPGSQGSKFFNVIRAFQGIGPSILLPNAIAILGVTYPAGKKKNMVFSLFGSTAPGGAVIAASFAALLAEKAWWPWAFWILAITTFLCAILSLFVIPHIERDAEQNATSAAARASWQMRWSILDGNGALAGVIGLILINISWNQAPNVGWPTPYVYVLLIIGFLFIVGFCYIESTAAHPLVPIRSIGRDVGFVLGCIAFGWSSFGIWLFYSWQILLVLRDVRPLLASAQFLPPTLSGLCAAIATGLVMHKLGPGAAILISMFPFCIGNILVATMPVHQTYWAQLFVALVVMPWGMDMSFPAASIITSNSMPREHQGMAASLVTTIVNYSISLGLGFAGTVETRVLANGGNTLEGYRSALYLAIGLSGLAIGLGLVFNAVGLLGRTKKAQAGESEISA